MAVPLQTRVFYGLKTDINGNALYITDTEVLYPVGHVLAVHDIPHRQQRLIRLPDKFEMNIICISPNKKYAGVAEMGEKPTLSIYDLKMLKRRKLLGIPYDAPGVTKFTCINFTCDNKYLAAVTGEPDQTMLFYNWERGKVETTFKVAIPQNPLAITNLISCNPTDASVVAVAGSFAFKFLTCSDTVWRPYGFSKAENLIICSMDWLDGDRLLAGTVDGRVLYMENGEFKNIYKMADTMVMNLKIRTEFVMPTTTVVTPSVLEEDLWEQSVLCIVGFPRGFAYAQGPGTVVMFEKEGKHRYIRRNVYEIPILVTKDFDPLLNKVHMMDINPSSERLVVTTGWSQLFYIALWGPDLKMEPKPQEWLIMGEQLHHGPIGDIDMCAWKPVFMTCGEHDRSIRLWNFETESLILLKQYNQDLHGIALHPMGLFCLIGFNDKLRFMSILIDNLVPMHEIAIRNCKIVCFSHNGHMFAAVNINVVQVYTTTDFICIFTLKGHTGNVKALLWSQSDLKMLSLGAEDAIYEWDMTTGTRVGEIILKGTNLRGIALSADTSFSYCIASDDRIREIKENEVVRRFRLKDKEMQSMIMTKDDLVLFVTTPGGIITSLKSPLQLPLEWSDFHLHCVDITKIVLSYNENYLVSIATDGSMCIWRVNYAEGKIIKISKPLKYTKEVLIGQEDLEEKIQTIKIQIVRMREMESEHAYKLRQIDVLHNEKLRDVHQGYCEAINELRDKIEKIQDEHANEINNINVDIMKMKAAHNEAMQRMEKNYEHKLIIEYDKFQAFEEQTNIMRANYETQLEDLAKRDLEKLQMTITKYEALVHEKKLQLEETSDEMTNKERVHEHLMMQIEDDADREILSLRTNYENLLYEEKQSNLKLKGEAGVMRNKFMASQKDVDDLKRQMHRVQAEYAQFIKNIQELEKQITELKKEITERDATIQDKEEQIYNIKRSNQELEKFKFVLNYKIQELKNQIEPRDREIAELKENLRAIETELLDLHKVNGTLELQLDDVKQKLHSARHEIDCEKRMNRICEQLLRRIRVDILDVAGLVQEPIALKIAVKNLFHKYSADDEFLRSRKAEQAVQCEFCKQRDHLERTVASLKRQVLKDTTTSDKDLEKMTEENSTLIVELNDLRENLKDARQHVLHTESLLGLKLKDIRPAEAAKMLEQAYYGYEELNKKYTAQLREYQQVVLALKEDIQRLLSKIPCDEAEEEEKRKKS